MALVATPVVRDQNTWYWLWQCGCDASDLVQDSKTRVDFRGGFVNIDHDDVDRLWVLGQEVECALNAQYKALLESPGGGLVIP